MNSTIEQYYKNKDQYKDLKKEDLIKLYRSEDIATAYSSSTLIGEHMAEDFEQNRANEIKVLLEDNLASSPEKRLHAWRHAFAALAVYAARLHKNGQDDTFPVPTEFLSCKKRKKTTNEVSLEVVFRNFLQISQAEGVRAYLEQYESKNFSSSDMLQTAFIKFVHNLQAAADAERQRLENSKNGQNNPLPQKAIDSIEHNIDELNTLSIEVKNAASFAGVKDVFQQKATKTSVEKVFDHASKTKDGFDGPVKDVWFAASILINLYPLYKAYGEEYDFRFILFHFIQEGKQNIGYIKNLPYFLYDIQREDTSEAPQWIGDIEEEVHRIIKENELDCTEILHVGDFLHDFYYVVQSVIDYGSLIGELIDVPSDALKPDSDRIHILEKQVALLRENLFIDELEWKELPIDRREAHKTKRGLLLYEYFVNLPDPQIAKKVILYIFRDLSSVMKKNNHVTAFLLRLFKKAVYKEQDLYTTTGKQNNVETYFRISERRLFLTLKLLEISDWKGTVEKDVATILVTTIENFYENMRELSRRTQREKNPKGDELAEYFKKAYRLLYYVFYKVKSLNLYEEMASFCTARDENSIYERFLTHLGDKKDPAFSSYLITGLIPPDIDKNESSGNLPDVATLQLMNLHDLDKLRSADFMERFRELVMWNHFMTAATRGKDWFFYQDYPDNTGFFEEKERESRIHSETVFHRFSNLIWELDERFNLIEIEYTKESGYSIQYSTFKLSNFIQLADILQETLQYLNELEFLVNSELPYKERQLFIGGEAKHPREDTITMHEDSIPPFGINGLQSYLRTERASLIHLNNAVKEGDEEKVIKILEDIPPGGRNDQKRRNVLSFLQKWFYQRFNFKRLLQGRLSRGSKNPLKWGGKAHALGRYIARTASCFPFVLSLIAIPFIIHIIDTSVSKYIYAAVVYGLILFFGLLPLHALLMLIHRKWGGAGKEYRAAIRLSDFFMPRMLAIIFVAYSTMYFADEVWTIAITQRYFPGITTMVLMLAFSYLILHSSIFRKMTIPRSEKRQRILSIMSIGLFESFVLNLFNGIFITSKMMHPTRADYRTVFDDFPIQSNFHLPANIILFGEEFTVFPYLIILWTIQTFVIGIILHIFLEGRNIMENER